MRRSAVVVVLSMVVIMLVAPSGTVGQNSREEQVAALQTQVTGLETQVAEVERTSASPTASPKAPASSPIATPLVPEVVAGDWGITIVAVDERSRIGTGDDQEVAVGLFLVVHLELRNLTEEPTYFRFAALELVDGAGQTFPMSPEGTVRVMEISIVTQFQPDDPMRTAVAFEVPAGGTGYALTAAGEDWTIPLPPAA